MKRISLVIISVVFALGCFAQDIIVKKDGSIIQAKVVKVGTAEVDYKKWSNQDGPSYAIAKSDILAINYQNGEKDTFENEAIQSQSNIESKNISLNEYSTTSRNIEAIEAINNAPFQFIKGKIKKNKAKHYGLQYGIGKNSIVQSDYVSVNFKTGRIMRPGQENEMHYFHSDYWLNEKTPFMTASGIQTISVKVTNNTEKIIYVDLANSFISKGQQAEPLYTATASTTSNSNSTGTSFNIGGITNALGIGGVAGALANATTINGGQSTTKSTVVFSQRIISIPPHSSMLLPYKTIEDATFLTSRRNSNIQNNVTYVTLDSILEGEELSFGEENSPQKLTFFLTLSHDETFLECFTSTTSLYCKKAIGLGSSDGYNRVKFDNIDFSESGLYLIGKNAH